jgi:mannitol-1-phosphate/altronate dehydrogenase
LASEKGFNSMLTLTPSLIGIGVTEAGICFNSIPMRALVAALFVNIKTQTKISVVNTDNVMDNGVVIKGIIKDLITKAPDDADFADYGWVTTGTFSPSTSTTVATTSAFLDYLDSSVTFHTSMVDRIVSHRKGSNPFNQIPSCEPLPPKAICIADPKSTLPDFMVTLPEKYGIIVRTEEQLKADIELKLRVANGTHSPLASVLALNGYSTTGMLSKGSQDADRIMGLLDSYYKSSVMPSAVSSIPVEPLAVDFTYSSWRQRLQHPGFGLSSFFICQNAAQKVGVRIVPTVNGLDSPTVDCCVSTALMLMFLTPEAENGGGGGTYQGKAKKWEGQEEEEYAPGLTCKGEGGKYTFKVRALS